jgi:hypothetical protein
VKLTRRSFIGLLSAIPFAPLVAKDLGDFEFLPPEQPIVPFLPTERFVTPVNGQMRYNETTQQFEVYVKNHWEVLVSMENYQNDRS